jgi:Adenylate and Guanylate cyclase catalytic domain
VTAGVLRGEKSRFQLFGDAVNTAARLQTTGDRGKIHLSSETAKLLTEAGRDHWIVPRTHAVEAKGKGALNTFWLEIAPRCGRRSTNHSTTDASSSGNLDDDAITPELDIDSWTKALVDWNTDGLARLLKEIAARRGVAKQGAIEQPDESKEYHQPGQTALDEVKEIIHLPDFDATSSSDSPATAELSEDVMNQLQSFVTSSKCHPSSLRLDSKCWHKLVLPLAHCSRDHFSSCARE